MDWPTFVWMFIVLKIPVVAALWLIWWAVTAEPEPAAEDGQDGGGGGRQPRPQPRRPQGPRRGDHPLPRPSAPQRVRARGEKLSRTGR